MPVRDDQGQPYRAYNADVLLDRNIDEFIGISRGLLADGNINQAESEFLLRWIEDHKQYAHEYPMNVLYSRLKEMLQDGVLDDEESQELVDMLKQLTGEDKNNEAVPNNSTSLPLDMPLPNVIIPGKSFVFTGIFSVGTRKRCEEIVSELGGEMHKTVKSDTDYLVIGDVGSDHWAHSSFGRKIEKAVKLRDEKNSGISIISEHHWIQAL